MRSDQVHRALSRNINRFEVCQLVSKGVRATHKLGSRFEDTINNALDYLGDQAPRPASAPHTGKAESKTTPMQPAA
jgi:hypothetical protein